MASLQKTFSGDLSTFMAMKIFDIISDARVEKGKATKMAEKYGVDVDFTPGEFTARSARNALIEGTVGKRFVPRTSTRDLISRGQSTPFASPLASDYFNRGQSSPLPTAVQKATKAGQPFPNIAVGAPLSSQVKPQTPAVPSSSSAPIQSTTGQKPVKVKDQKLGVYLAAVIKALNANIASINERLDDTEQGVIEAKEGVFGTIKQLEQNSDLLETKLDAIIAALREQNTLAKVQEDQSEVQRREDETEGEMDLSGTERVIKPDEKKEDTIQLNLLEDIQDSAEKRDEQLSLPFFGGSEGFEKGGIVSGPDSGYLAKLHGDEMIIPLDNNYTQGEPSAVDGKVRPKPQTPVVQKYEVGTKSPAVTETPLPSMGPKIFERSAAVDNKLPDLMEKGGELQKAMEFPVKAAGIITMNVMQEAVSNMGGLAGGVAQQLKQISAPLAAAFGVSNTITTSLIRGKSAEKETGERKKKTQRFTTNKKKRAWWDPLGVFTGKGGGYRKGSGGPGGWMRNQWNRFTNYVSKPFTQPQGLARGTSGVRAGFTGMNKQGFDAMMQGQGYRASTKPQILGHGAYSAPTFKGAQRYAGATGSLGGMQTPGGVVNSIVPGNAPRINMIEPQVKVRPEMFNKGRDLATKLQSGAYPNSARANMLRAQITSGGVRPPMPKSSIRPGNPLSMLIQLIADELINPRAAGMYDQISGPNAYYNAPGYRGPKPQQNLQPPAAAAAAKAAFVDMGSQNQALSRFNKQTRQPEPIIINNQTAANNNAEVPLSHISNMGDPGFSSLYPSPR